MRMKQVGNKREIMAGVIQNGDTGTILEGSPVAWTFGSVSTNVDGLSVVNLATAGASSYAEAYGVALGTIAPNQYGEAIVFGYCGYALVTVLTRSASSAVWPSTAAIATGAILQLDTANNAFSVFSSALAQTNFQPFAVLLDSVLSATTQASTTAGTGSSATASVVAHRALIRMM
jgi:hypothetical protein